jgi:hypothetical protein
VAGLAGSILVAEVIGALARAGGTDLDIHTTTAIAEFDREHYPFVPAQAGHFPTESIV